MLKLGKLGIGVGRAIKFTGKKKNFQQKHNISWGKCDSAQTQPKEMQVILNCWLISRPKSVRFDHILARSVSSVVKLEFDYILEELISE